MKILVFGGSFDPIHKGHLVVADQAQRALGFDEVWFVPCTSSRYGKVLGYWVDRTNMIERALEDYPAFKLSEAEADSNARGRMYTLATHLKDKHPDFEFQFLVGSDSSDKINNWYRAEELLSEFKFVIVPRTQESSTTVRAQIKESGSSDLVTKRVNEYIKERNLYV